MFHTLSFGSPSLVHQAGTNPFSELPFSGRRLLVSVSYVVKARQRLVRSGSPTPRPQKPPTARKLLPVHGALQERVARAPDATLAEHRDRLTGTVRFSDGHLDRLTIAAIRAAYSERSTSEAEARDALRDARTAIRDIRSDAGLLRRLRGVYRPGL